MSQTDNKKSEVVTTKDDAENKEVENSSVFDTLWQTKVQELKVNHLERRILETKLHYSKYTTIPVESTICSCLNFNMFIPCT